MLFIDAVNRILRINGFIRGDTDPIASFSDTQHSATMQQIQIAIQSELLDLDSVGLIPSERVETTLQLIAHQRVYTLPSNFARLYGNPPYFFDNITLSAMLEYSGGENQLRQDTLSYKTDEGYPFWWYMVDGTATKQVAFYPVPNPESLPSLTYDYEKSVTPTAAGDSMPFHNNDEAYMFCDVAAVRAKMIYEGQPVWNLHKNPDYNAAKATLIALISGTNPTGKYGKSYVS